MPEDFTYHVYKITAVWCRCLRGQAAPGAPTPGPATSSKLGYPFALTADAAGDVFVADTDYSRIDRITAAGTLSVVAGNGTAGTPVDGPALSSPLDTVKFTMGADAAGNVYFQDSGHIGGLTRGTIKKVTPSGTLSTIAGNGTFGTPVAGPAHNSPMPQSYGGLPVDAAGNVYLTDPAQYVVVKITPSGTLARVAGTGVDGPSARRACDEQPDRADPPPGRRPRGQPLPRRRQPTTSSRRSRPQGILSIYAGTGRGRRSGGGQPATELAGPVPLPGGRRRRRRPHRRKQQLPAAHRRPRAQRPARPRRHRGRRRGDAVLPRPGQPRHERAHRL